MNAALGWLLVALAIGVGYVQYGWQGVVLGITVGAFWLVLQVNRTLRVMRRAAESPKAGIDSAVMLNAKLKAGMSLLDVTRLTKSLGERVGAEGAGELERWRWRDAGDVAIVLEMRRGKLARWTIERPAGGDDDAEA